MQRTMLTLQFKKWYIRNIEFYFLSYGENQRLDFDKIEGLIVVESPHQILVVKQY